MTNWLNKFGITDQLTVTDRGVYQVTLGISDFFKQISDFHTEQSGVLWCLHDQDAKC